MADNLGAIGSYAAMNLAANPITTISLEAADYNLFATGAVGRVDQTFGLAGSGSQTHVPSGWPLGGGAYCRIVPPTTNQLERGIFVGNMNRNNSLILQELTYRWQTRYSPSFFSMAGLGPKYCIVHTRRTNTAGNSEDRPAMFLRPMANSQNPALGPSDTVAQNRANTGVICPSAETFNGWVSYPNTYGDTWSGSGGTVSFYPNSVLPFYLVNDADNTPTFQGRPCIKAGEPITFEHRIVTKAIPGYPRGLIAFRMYRENGDIFQMGIPWNWDTSVPMNCFIYEIQQFGCGQWNAVGGPNVAWIDIGTYVTVSRDLSVLRPDTDGWLGRIAA